MRLWLFLLAAGCSTTSGNGTKTQAAQPTGSAECTADADCAIAEFPDPAKGGCCEGLCERPLVTAREAERRRLAWEAQCAAVRCANPGCPEAEPPAPVCREGQCR